MICPHCHKTFKSYLTQDDVEMIYLEDKLSIKEIAEETGLDRKTIYRIKHKKTYRKITDKLD